MSKIKGLRQKATVRFGAADGAGLDTEGSEQVDVGHAVILRLAI